MKTLTRYTAAAIQATPVWLDREATTEKAVRLIGEAAAEGARLIVFPEAWLPTFPYWPRALPQPDTKLSLAAYVELYKQAVDVPGPVTERLGEAARKANAYVAIGVNERDAAFGNTLFNTLLYFGPDGRLLGRHRKLMPTFEEKCVWSVGDGADLEVYDTEIGRLGGLICGNNWMTLPKYYLLASGEQVHVSVWPNRRRISEMAELANRAYAYEGQVFVVAASGFIRAEDVPDDFALKDRTLWEIDGGSGIVGPDGKFLAGPVYGEEAIVTAEIDLDRIIALKANMDTIGNYARPDVFRLQVRRETWTNVVAHGATEADGWRAAETRAAPPAPAEG